MQTAFGNLSDRPKAMSLFFERLTILGGAVTYSQRRVLPHGARPSCSYCLPPTITRFRRLRHRHFESACWKEPRPLRKVAPGACVYTQVYTGVENSGQLGPPAPGVAST